MITIMIGKETYWQNWLTLLAGVLLMLAFYLLKKNYASILL